MWEVVIPQEGLTYIKNFVQNRLKLAEISLVLECRRGVGGVPQEGVMVHRGGRGASRGFGGLLFSLWFSCSFWWAVPTRRSS